MNPLVITAAVLAGFALGWIQRPVIFGLAVPAAGPVRRSCPRCGSQLLDGWWIARPVLPPSGRCPGVLWPTCWVAGVPDSTSTA